jgi:hypothetical protein
MLETRADGTSGSGVLRPFALENWSLSISTPLTRSAWHSSTATSHLGNCRKPHRKLNDSE